MKSDLSYPAYFPGQFKPPIHGLVYACNFSENFMHTPTLKQVWPMWSSSNEYDVKQWLETALISTMPPLAGTQWGDGRQFVRGTDTAAGSAPAFQVTGGVDAFQADSVAPSVIINIITELIANGVDANAGLVSWEGSNSGEEYSIFYNSFTDLLTITITNIVSTSVTLGNFVDSDRTRPVNITGIWNFLGNQNGTTLMVDGLVVSANTVSSPATGAADYSTGTLYIGCRPDTKATLTANQTMLLMNIWSDDFANHGLAGGAVPIQGAGYMPALNPFWTILPINAGLRALPVPLGVPSELPRRFPRKFQLHHLGR